MSRFIDLSHLKHIVALSDASDVRYLQDLVPFYFDALRRFNRILVSRGFILYSKQWLFYFTISPPRRLFCNKHKMRAFFIHYSKLAEASKRVKKNYVEATHHPIA